MSDVEVHIKAAREKRLAALDEYEKKRYMVVGDLAIKTVEQAIEAFHRVRRRAFSRVPKKRTQQQDALDKEKATLTI